ncbi:hypothetical protein ACFSC6_12355 [Rufibacter sediminis]|uniref:Uncharacterized protein n=1 Tax=Rufibacter sediminis TaxID=2762756 RepID=A0ABR6VUT0_9BACT|nr:hypothetical protein [Rufibacter sediminis]MBC3540675.1 hypothetical protein [Rufibacter sediminis]
MFLLKYWQPIAAATLAVLLTAPVAYKLGTWHGARQEKNEAQARQLLADAKNDVKTVSELALVRKMYEPIYVEIEKYVEAPACAVPAVIRDTINRLPGPKAAH